VPPLRCYVTFLGRLATYNYLDMDDVVAQVMVKLGAAEEAAVLLKAAEQYFTQVTSESSQTGEEALQSILSMGFDDPSKMSLLARLSDDLPFESWAEFSKVATSGDSKNDSFRRRIIDGMVKLDPGKTIAELVRSGQPKDLEGAIRAWAKADQSKPLEWLKKHQNELSPGHASQAFAGLSRSLAEAGQMIRGKTLPCLKKTRLMVRCYGNGLW
jgi:hypothetical protein